MPTSLKYSDLTMREKSAIDALRLLDGESRNREQNFLAIVSGYRARVAELEALAGAVKATEFSGIRCLDVAGVNWFDRREELLGEAGGSPTPHPDTVRLERLAIKASLDATVGWWMESGGITPDDLRAYIDGMEG